MNLIKRLFSTLAGHQLIRTSWREMFFSSLGAFATILVLVVLVRYFSFGMVFSLPILASMGASAFLLFVVPHSPMAQPWPVIGGHLLAAVIGVACAQWIANPALATAMAVGLSIFAMHGLNCLHPPSSATAMIAVLGGAEVHSLGWQFCYEVVFINAAIILLLAFVINNLIPGRRYPLYHSHLAERTQIQPSPPAATAKLTETDFQWALGQMDGLVDVSVEDLVDLVKLATKHAQSHK